MKYYLMLFSLVFFLGSCKTDEEFIEPNLGNFVAEASSNDLIKSEIIGGNTNRSSYIRQVVSKSPSEWFAISLDASAFILGLMDVSGSYQWTRALNFNPKNIIKFEHENNTFILVVGYDDYNEDELIDIRIVLYNEFGDKQDELNILDADYSVWLNSIDVVGIDTDKLSFKAVGGATQNDTNFPYLIAGQIDLVSNQFEVDLSNDTGSRIFTELPNRHFGDIITEESVSYISYNMNDNNGNQVGFGVLKEENDLIVWDELVESNINKAATSIGGLAINGNQVVIGGTEKINKPENEGDQKDWEQVVVYSLDKSSGSEKWMHTLNKSYRDDSFFGLTISDDELYVLGGTASWVNEDFSTDLYLGYGFLSNIDLANGNEQWFHSFGDSNFRQRVNTISIQGDQINLFGFTNFRTPIEEGGYFELWMIELDRNDL